VILEVHIRPVAGKSRRRMPGSAAELEGLAFARFPSLCVPRVAWACDRSCRVALSMRAGPPTTVCLITHGRLSLASGAWRIIGSDYLEGAGLLLPDQNDRRPSARN
jgi:hypothetical protein